VTREPELSLWVHFQERNHQVALGTVTPADLEEWDPWPWPGLSIGCLYATCHQCAGERWPVYLSKNGKPRGRWWWLCPRGCNLSEQCAKRLLAGAARGAPLPQGVTEAHCRGVIATGEARRAHVRHRGSWWTTTDLASRDRLAGMTDAECATEQVPKPLPTITAVEFYGLLGEEPPEVDTDDLFDF
jgi:hypothetical protein